MPPTLTEIRKRWAKPGQWAHTHAETDIEVLLGLLETQNCGSCFSCLAEQGCPVEAMIVCPKCGNKRCPKATHHGHACTGSNEPGQPGSRYPKP